MSWVFFNHSHAPNLTRNEICAEVLRSTPKFEGYSEGYFVFIIVFVILYCIYWVSSLILFRYYQRFYIEYRLQSFPLIVFQSSLPILLIVVGPLRDVTGRENWSCDVYFWARAALSPFMALGVILRIHDLIIRKKLHELLAKARLQAIYELRANASTGIETKDSFAFEEQSSVDSETEVTTKAIEKELKRISLVFYLWVSVGAFAILFVSIVIVNSIYIYYWKGCTGCLLGPVEFVISSVSGVFFVFIDVRVISFLILAPKNDDTLGILKEIRLTVAFLFLLIYPPCIMLMADPWLLITVTGKFSWEWLSFFGAQVLHFFPVTYRIIQTWKQQHNFQARTSASDKCIEEMLEMINDAQAEKSFRKHLINEFNVEHLRFYEEVQHFRVGYPKFSNKQRVLFAKRIYESFIPSTVFMQINISADLRSQMGKKIEDAETRGDIEVDFFSKAEQEVLLMLRDSFLRYKQSHTYREYMRLSRRVISKVDDET